MPQRPMNRVELEVGVRPKSGITIEAWLRFHEEKEMNRAVQYKGLGADGNHIVTLTYEARGADSSDLMRPYRETKEWLRLADVIQIGKSRFERNLLNE